MSNFTIDQHSGHWLVEWHNLGPVESDKTKWALLDVAFDQIKSWEVGIGTNIKYRGTQWQGPRVLKDGDPMNYENYKNPTPIMHTDESHWFVQWISCEAWLIAGNNERIKHALFAPHHGKDVTGIVFTTLDEARKFVDKMEARLTFHRLKQDYR